MKRLKTIAISTKKTTLLICNPTNNQITFPNNIDNNDNSLLPNGIKIINGSKADIIFNIENSSIFKNCLIILEKDNESDNIKIFINRNCILKNIKIVARNGKLCIAENTIINDMTVTLNDNQIYIGKNCYLDGNSILNAMDNNLACSENLMIYDNVHYFNKFGILYMILSKLLSFFGYKSLIIYMQNFIKNSNNQIRYIKSNIQPCILLADPSLPFKKPD